MKFKVGLLLFTFIQTINEFSQCSEAFISFLELDENSKRTMHNLHIVDYVF